MIEIPENCGFLVEKADQIHLDTKTNGDKIIIRGLRLSAEQAASLAFLINTNKTLKVKIKENTPA